MNTMPKIPLMIVSFALSLILWAYVQVQENPSKPLKTSYALPVEIRGLPDTFVVVRKPDTITIFPTGPLEERRMIDEKDLSAFVDLSHVDLAGAKNGAIEASYPVHIVVKGDYTMTWSPKNPTAIIRIERVVSKTIPVMVVAAGEPQNKDYLYLPDTSYTEPRTVTITGPESDVNDVATAWTTFELSSAVAGKTYQGDVYLRLSDSGSAPSTVKLDPEIVLIHPDIIVAPLTRMLHVLPTFKGVPAFGFTVKSIEVSPENVQVRGPSDAITPMSFISTQAIDITGIKDTTTFFATPNLPPQVIAASMQGQVISVKVVVVPTATAPAPQPAKSETKQKARRRRPRP